MSEFANEKDDNNYTEAEIKENIISSSAFVNGVNSKLSLENESDFKGEKTKREIKNIIEKGKFTEYYPKKLQQPLNFILIPNNVNPIIHQKNKFDFNSVRSFGLQKIVQHKSTNRTNSNINYTKFDINADPFFPKDIKLKKDFNNYVAVRLANREKYNIMKIYGWSLSFQYSAFAFDSLEGLTLTNCLECLWADYCISNNEYIKYDEAIQKSICVLNKTNENNLLKLINEIKIRIDLNGFVSQNKIDFNNFDAKFDELKNKYGEKNISPIAACYFLSAIKKDDLTTERLNKVWNEVNTNLLHSFSADSNDNRLISLVNNLLDGNFRSDKYLDIFIFCLRLDMRFKYPGEPEDLYNIIYGIITNSEDYKQANGNEEQETAAIKNFFDPDGFFKKFWITLAELDANDHTSHKFFYSKNLTMRKMKELASNQKNKYSRKLSNLLQDHDIYISPTTEKTKDDKGKEVDQICIKVDSYKQIEENAQNGLNEYMKKVIDDLKNDQNVEYDWVNGKLTYNKKIIYDFKEVEFYNEKGEICNLYEETMRFCGFVVKAYCEDNELPSYRFDLGLFPNDMREIQKIVGEKYQAKLKELIDGFGKFVDAKIEEYGKSKEILFMKDNRLRIKVIDSLGSWSALAEYGVSDAAGVCVEEYRCSYWKGKFYRSISREEIDSDMYNNLTAKFKRLLNDKIGEYVKNNKLNYEYDKKNNCWKQIAEKSMEEKNKHSDNPLKEENKNPEINPMEKTSIKNKIENEKNDKIEEKITEESIDKKKLEADINTVLRNAKKSLGLENKFDVFLKNIIDELENTPNLIKVDWVNGTIQCDKIGKEKIVINKDGNLGLLAFSICKALKYKFLFENNISLEQIHSFDFLQFENNGVRLKKILEDMQNSKINELKIKEDLLNNIKSQIKCQYEKHTWYTNTMEFDGMISILYGDSKHYFTNADEAAIFLLRKELEQCCKGKFYTINILDQKTFNGLKSELIKMLKDEIKNHIKSNNNGDISKEDKNNEENKNNNIKNENEDKKDKDKIEIENINSYNTGEEKKDELEKSENKTDLIENGVNKKIENINTNTDENKNQNEIEMKNRKENNEIEYGTKNETSEELSNQDKTVVNQENENINSKTDENKIQENPNNIKSQTLGLSHTNNQDQSGTKNKCWIKLFKVLKIIAFVGFILALAMTVLSIFIASLSSVIIKFVIATVVLFCIFLVSQFLVSCLSNKQPKENKSPYPNQIDTGIETKENQNEFDINKSKHESNINQIGEQEKNNVSSIEDSLG